MVIRIRGAGTTMSPISVEGLTVEENAVDPSVVAQLNTSATVSIGLALRNLEARG